ncbi:Crp/Fnr family transcriptional regulator [Ornithinibacillus halotolerans]|uniref:cAMP-binding protein n=1 Tax=Ornithinibacillus halotolerans TaxID=1274357 RepID=A0A916RWM4_9BACI|nr:Crp/Fnr family transcriptional regulator [Ornithinibacillus halotolerans]GGA74561.1 cAMP-binding protein [Ornithinibacillus halotolerans]
MTPKAIRELLQRFTLFKDLTEEEMIPIVELAKHRLFFQGTHLFMHGDPLTSVYFIQKGKIKIYRTDIHGKEQIINVLGPGEMFPHQGFFRKDNYPAHAEVMEDSNLIYIPINLFENFLINHPEICVKLFKVLGDKIVDLQNRLEEKMLHNTYEQVILLLLRLAKNNGKEHDEKLTKITLQLTNRELANMIGSSRETVSRTLTQLKKKNLVSSNDSGYLLIDMEALQDELI